MRKVFEIGGLIASVVLIAFGATAIVMGVDGRDTVRTNLAAEQISFGDAKTDPTVPAKYSNHLVNTGAEARAFAKMMRVHTLESSHGLTYAQMGRFVAKDGTRPSSPTARAARASRSTRSSTRRRSSPSRTAPATCG
jgi:hypothetical protein